MDKESETEMGKNTLICVKQREDDIVICNVSLNERQRWKPATPQTESERYRSEPRPVAFTKKAKPVSSCYGLELKTVVVLLMILKTNLSLLFLSICYKFIIHQGCGSVSRCCISLNSFFNKYLPPYCLLHVYSASIITPCLSCLQINSYMPILSP